jgi:hypothetical protein
MFYFINTFEKGFNFGDKSYDELSDEEFMSIADITYSIEDFVWAFNHEEICDQWYVRFIEQK